MLSVNISLSPSLSLSFFSLSPHTHTHIYIHTHEITHEHERIRTRMRNRYQGTVTYHPIRTYACAGAALIKMRQTSRIDNIRTRETKKRCARQGNQSQTRLPAPRHVSLLYFSLLSHFSLVRSHLPPTTSSLSPSLPRPLLHRSPHLEDGQADAVRADRRRPEPLHVRRTRMHAHAHAHEQTNTDNIKHRKTLTHGRTLSRARTLSSDINPQLTELDYGCQL